MPNILVRPFHDAKLYVNTRSLCKQSYDVTSCKKSNIVEKKLGINSCKSKADCNARLIEGLKRVKEFHDAGIKKIASMIKMYEELQDQLIKQEQNEPSKELCKYEKKSESDVTGTVILADILL